MVVDVDLEKFFDRVNHDVRLRDVAFASASRGARLRRATPLPPEAERRWRAGWRPGLRARGLVDGADKCPHRKSHKRAMMPALTVRVGDSMARDYVVGLAVGFKRNRGGASMLKATRDDGAPTLLMRPRAGSAPLFRQYASSTGNAFVIAPTVRGCFIDEAVQNAFPYVFQPTYNALMERRFDEIAKGGSA